MNEAGPGSAEWAGRFEQQAASCATLGSDLWSRLLRIIALDVEAEGPSWSVVRERADLRFGQAGPLRLVGAAHRLALTGEAPEWAALLPSCGGTAPVDGDVGDRELGGAWLALVAAHGEALVAGLDREVQTNEVGRAAALGYAHAVALGRSRFGGAFRPRTTDSTATAGGVADPMRARLIELGCSGGLNLRLDRFRLDLSRGSDAAALPDSAARSGAARPDAAVRLDAAARSDGVVLGDLDGQVRLSPQVRTPIAPGLSTASTVPVVERIGIDPHPIDPTTDDGRLTLLSFVWPDQVERFERLGAAIDVARALPATLVRTGDRTVAELLSDVLSGSIGASAPHGVATIVQHSIVWQYIPTDQRPAVTHVIEAAGERATLERPLVWVRFEPDEWDRTRAAVWVRSWPDGGDRLVAHADFHGRWLAPVPSP